MSHSGTFHDSRKNGWDQLIFGHCDFSFGGYGANDDIFPLFLTDTSRVATKLLKAGADINQKTAIGQTVLHKLCTSYDDSQALTKFSFDDDDSHSDKTKLIMILMDHGADVNICDDFGKSPLHYAAQNGSRYYFKILLQNGANVQQKDKAGLTVLQYAAMHDYLLTMALISKYHFPVKQIIQAYECVALHAPSPLELLRKAALLREENGIPKGILPPLECFGSKKEWETIEELEEFGNDKLQILLACVLARERMSQDMSLDIAKDAVRQCKCFLYKYCYPGRSKI